VTFEVFEIFSKKISKTLENTKMLEIYFKKADYGT